MCGSNEVSLETTRGELYFKIRLPIYTETCVCVSKTKGLGIANDLDSTHVFGIHVWDVCISS